MKTLIFILASALCFGCATLTPTEQLTQDEQTLTTTVGTLTQLNTAGIVTQSQMKKAQPYANDAAAALFAAEPLLAVATTQPSVSQTIQQNLDEISTDLTMLKTLIATVQKTSTTK